MPDIICGTYSRRYLSPCDYSITNTRQYSFDLDDIDIRITVKFEPAEGGQKPIGPGELQPKTSFTISLEKKLEVTGLNKIDEDEYGAAINFNDMHKIGKEIKYQMRPIADAIAAITIGNISPYFIQSQPSENVYFTSGEGEIGIFYIPQGSFSVSVSGNLDFNNIQYELTKLIGAVNNSLLLDGEIGAKLFLRSIEARYHVEQFLLCFACLETVINYCCKIIGVEYGLTSLYNELTKYLNECENGKKKEKLQIFVQNKKYCLTNPSLREKFKMLSEQHSDSNIDEERSIFKTLVSIRNEILHGRRVDIPEAPLISSSGFELSDTNPISSVRYLYIKYLRVLITTVSNDLT